MKKYILIIAVSSMLAGKSMAAMEDDPLLTMVNIEKFEIQDGDEGNPVVLDAYAWVGKDINKFWMKTEIERVDGLTEESELQMLYSRALYPFWDIQIGWRRDIDPGPKRDWLAIGLQGLAPYMFEVDAGIFIGESGRLAARLDAEYEYMLTQKWVLSPEIEMNFYSKDDTAVGVGSGLANASLGLRLRYEIRREFAPYIGINWEKDFGDTADLTEVSGEESSDSRLVMGIRAWF